MAHDDDLAAHAQELVDATMYVTLGTVDPDGRPWTSPVYFVAEGVREFYWASEVDARHSRNLDGNPQVSLVVFDSTVRPYHGRALYATGEAAVLSGADLDRGLEVYPGRGGSGGTAITLEDVVPPSPFRLYRATATDVWVLCPRESGETCPIHDLAKDHRVRVP